MRIILIFLLLSGFAANAYTKDLENSITNGTVYVDGSKSSKQVFIHQNNKADQLSHYSRWENIDSLFVSPDKRYLIVYHRANKESHFRITLYDLETRKLIADAAPGWACIDIQWFRNKILFISGATGAGTIVLAYNYKLKKLFDLEPGYLFIDTKNAVSFTYPVYAADYGIFTLYDLDTGTKKSSFDFKQKVKEGYILDSVKNISDKSYNFVLWTLDTHKKVTVMKTLE